MKVNLKQPKNKESMRLAKLIRDSKGISFSKAMKEAWDLIKKEHKKALAPSTLSRTWLASNFDDFVGNSAKAKRAFEKENSVKISRSQFYFIWRTFKEKLNY